MERRADRDRDTTVLRCSRTSIYTDLTKAFNVGGFSLNIDNVIVPYVCSLCAKGIPYLFPGVVSISLGTTLTGFKKRCLTMVKFF